MFFGQGPSYYDQVLVGEGHGNLMGRNHEPGEPLY